MSCESRMYMKNLNLFYHTDFLCRCFERREADCECPLYTKSFRVWKLEEAAV